MYYLPENSRPEVSDSASAIVENVKPFHSIGINYIGTIQYRTKNKVSRKAYVCLFTCAVTRGVHLELVDDNTAQGFLYAFRKFAARRSYPKYIYSDNALNFRTVAPFLKDILSHQSVNQLMNEHNCEWKFIPSRAPWMGGFWERIIGIIKGCLVKALGSTLLTRQELEVVVIEVESYLNDRPLTYVSDSLGDATALTPSKLINGFNLNSPHFTNEELKFNNPDNLVRHLSFRYRMTLKVKSYFCKRWEKEYLAALRERQRSHPGIMRQVSLEDIVLIKEDGPRRNWRMGKVVKVHGGGDGYIRSVD